MRSLFSTTRIAVVAALLLAGATTASALPMSPSATAVPASVVAQTALEQIRFRGSRNFGGGGGGLGLGLGILGGLIIGNALSNDYYEGNQYYGGGGGDYSYCVNRFRSYDPASGTYLGFDGRRHSCP
jgi:hypothetical protein